MKKDTVLLKAAVLLLAAALLLASCAAFGARSGTGTVTVTLGGSSGAKALAATPSFNPVFSSMTLSVSGPDMATVSTTVNGNASSVSLDVPAGSDRTVTLYAPVDWTATATAYPNATLIDFAKAYGGSVTTDISASGTTNVAMKLEVVETKIILPSGTGIYISDSVTSDPVGDNILSLGSDYDFAFDRYGYLYVSNSDGVFSYSDENTGTSTNVVLSISSGMPLVYDSLNDLLWEEYYNSDTGTNLRNSQDNTDIDLSSTEFGYYWDNVLAVDKSGYLYVSVGNESEKPYIAKLSVSGTTATVVSSASYESLGLATGVDGYNLTAQDMTVQDGKLYILASELTTNTSYGSEEVSRGKIVAVKLSDLSKLAEYGWTDDNYPPESTTTLLYGPRRFIAIAPKKLIIADDGFWWSGLQNTYLKNRNGIAVLDTETGTLKRTAISGIEFFDDYSSVCVC